MKFPTRLLGVCGAIAIASGASAQTVLSANPAANNGGADGWGLYFDLTAECTDVLVSDLTTASNAVAAATFDLEIFVRMGSGLGGPAGMGVGSDPAGWTSLGTVTATQGAVASGISELIDIPDILVPGGETVGVALVYTGAGPRYFGTGTASLQTFTDGLVTLTAGDSRVAPFTTGGGFFSSRALVGAVTYTADEVAIVDDIPGAFIDISGTGMSLMQGDDTEVDIATTVGNALFPAGIARVGANGGIRFGGVAAELSFSNQLLPSASNCFSGDQALLPFWDDIAVNTGGDILWEEIGDTLIVQWDNASFFNNTDFATFQVQVFGSGPVAAQFIYQDIEQLRPAGGDSATIGYQAGGFGNDVEWSFNTAGSVMNGTVLSVISCERPVGINYCTAVANSTGAAASISATGSQSVAAMDLTFTVNDIPMDSFGFMLVGTEADNVPMASGGTGTLCVGGAIQRGVGGSILNSGMASSVSIVADVNMLTPSSAPVVQRDTLYFQYWFRDIGSTSNLSDGYRIIFE